MCFGAVPWISAGSGISLAIPLQFSGPQPRWCLAVRLRESYGMGRFNIATETLGLPSNRGLKPSLGGDLPREGLPPTARATVGVSRGVSRSRPLASMRRGIDDLLLLSLLLLVVVVVVMSGPSSNLFGPEKPPTCLDLPARRVRMSRREGTVSSSSSCQRGAISGISRKRFILSSNQIPRSSNVCLYCF